LEEAVVINCWVFDNDCDGAEQNCWKLCEFCEKIACDGCFGMGATK